MPMIKIKIRYRKVTEFSQDHTAGLWPGWDSNPDNLASKPVFLTTTYTVQREKSSKQPEKKDNFLKTATKKPTISLVAGFSKAVIEAKIKWNL